MRGLDCKELAGLPWPGDVPDTAERVIDDILQIISSESAYGGSNSSEADITYFRTKDWFPIKTRIATLKGKK